MAIDFQRVERAFPRYADHRPGVPVWCLTPDETGFIHRFFDTSPVSPSGRFVALTRLPVEDHVPSPGTPAEVVVVDLDTGARSTIAETCGWDTQLGAGVQWGRDDRELFYNDADPSTWELSCVMTDPIDGTRSTLPGSVYMVAPKRRQIVSTSLDRIGRSQAGYGVLLPDERVPRNNWAPSNDGIWVTDIDSANRRLLISFETLVDELLTEEERFRLGSGDFYGFHTKWSPDESQIMLVLRFLPRDGGRRISILVVVDADGSRPRLALPPFLWSDRGGHHPDWLPRSNSILMNLRDQLGVMRFIEIAVDGSLQFRELSSTIEGSGHPSVEPSWRYLVTDAYLQEPQAYGDGTVPIRLINLDADTERTVVRMRTEPVFTGEKNIMRVDPHPAWDSASEAVVFNGCPTGRRQVFLADLRSAMKPPPG